MSDRIISTPHCPWSVEVVGNDLIVRNVTATCFGGQYDDGDDGQTESGIPNDGKDPKALLVALPIRSTEAATKLSPLACATKAHIPWRSIVRVWRQGEDIDAVDCLLADNGPDVLRYPSHALDLNPNVAEKFAVGFPPEKLANEWSGSGFSYRVIGGAAYV